MAATLSLEAARALEVIETFGGGEDSPWERHVKAKWPDGQDGIVCFYMTNKHARRSSPKHCSTNGRKRANDLEHHDNHFHCGGDRRDAGTRTEPLMAFQLQFNDGLGWRPCTKHVATVGELVAYAQAHRTRWPNDDLRVVSDNPNHDVVVEVWKREVGLDGIVETKFPNPKFKRLARLRSLRAKKAPAWVVKSEQVALALERRGLKHRGIGKNHSKAQQALYVKHVLPLMGRETE